MKKRANWYPVYRIRSSFWKFEPQIFLEKRVKILEEFFFIFATRKSMHLSDFTTTVQTLAYSVLNKIVFRVAKAWPTNGRAGPCRAVPRRVARWIEYGMQKSGIIIWLASISYLVFLWWCVYDRILFCIKMTGVVKW